MKAVNADVIIVGSGVAGALVAERLARAGIGVAVLEAGSRIDRAQALGRYFNAPIKTPESPYVATPEADFPLSIDRGHWYRQSGPDTFKSTYLKAVGGTTWHWLGTCLRFLPNDFRLKSLYGRGVDWPIGYDELEPFYLEAERELGVAGESNEDLGSPRSGGFPLPAIASSYLDQVFERLLTAPASRSGQRPRHAIPWPMMAVRPAAAARAAFRCARFRPNTMPPFICGRPSGWAPRCMNGPRPRGWKPMRTDASRPFASAGRT